MALRFNAIFILVLLAVPMVFVKPVLGASEIDITVNPSVVIGNNKLSLGAMLDWEWKSWRDSSTQRQLTIDANVKLVRLFSVRNEPCTRWYESSNSGTWNWADMDALVRRIFEAGAEPLICLGYFGTPGGKLQVPSGMATDPATGLPYLQSYSTYCAEWVKHFKAVGLTVRYYEIVNEAYFYYGWDRTETRLIGNFANLFNSVAKSLRAVNTGVLLGNDASLQKKFLDYFVVHGESLDYLDFHKYALDENGGTDAQALSLAKTQRFTVETSNFYTLDQARQLWQSKRGKLLPVIITEGNLSYAWVNGTDIRIPQMIGAVYTAVVLREAILRGISYYVYYVFASSASSEQRRTGTGYGFGMVNSDNNQPWYPYYVYKMLGKKLSTGDQIASVASSSSEIDSLAWIHAGKLNVLLICEVNQPRTVYLHGFGAGVNFTKIDNTISWTTPRMQTGTVNSAQPLTINGYTVELLETQISGPSEQLLFEDGFEAGSLSKWNGTVTSSGETSGVASYAPYAGTYHGRFASDGSGGVENAYCFKTVSEEKIYVGGYFRFVKGLPLSDNDDRFYFLRLRSGDQSVGAVGIRRQNGVDRWTVFGRDGSDLVWPLNLASLPLELSRWYHIELQWEKTGSLGSFVVYIDGQKMFECLNLDAAGLSNITSVQCGIVYAYGVQNSLIVYTDSLKISDTMKF